MKQFRTWTQRQEIVSEAYSEPGLIRPTARKYDVSPQNIRLWKIRLDDISKQDDGIDVNRTLSRKSTQAGGRVKDLEAYEGLKVFYDNLRSMDRMVSVAMLAYEYLRLTKQVGYTDAIRKRIQRW